MEQGAASLGAHYGVADIVVGALVLAAVTSLPNAVAAVFLARRGRGAAALSTALNSNTVNVVAGLLVPAAVLGLAKPSASGLLIGGWYVGITALTLLLAYLGRGLRRSSGWLIIAAYVLFVCAAVRLARLGGGPGGGHDHPGPRQSRACVRPEPSWRASTKSPGAACGPKSATTWPPWPAWPAPGGAGVEEVAKVLGKEPKQLAVARDRLVHMHGLLEVPERAQVRFVDAEMAEWVAERPDGTSTTTAVQRGPARSASQGRGRPSSSPSQDAQLSGRRRPSAERPRGPGR